MGHNDHLVYRLTLTEADPNIQHPTVVYGGDSLSTLLVTISVLLHEASVGQRLVLRVDTDVQALDPPEVGANDHVYLQLAVTTPDETRRVVGEYDDEPDVGDGHTITSILAELPGMIEAAPVGTVYHVGWIKE